MEGTPAPKSARFSLGSALSDGFDLFAAHWRPVTKFAIWPGLLYGAIQAAARFVGHQLLDTEEVTQFYRGGEFEAARHDYLWFQASVGFGSLLGTFVLVIGLCLCAGMMYRAARGDVQADVLAYAREHYARVLPFAVLVAVAATVLRVVPTVVTIYNAHAGSFVSLGAAALSLALLVRWTWSPLGVVEPEADVSPGPGWRATSAFAFVALLVAGVPAALLSYLAVALLHFTSYFGWVPAGVIFCVAFLPAAGALLAGARVSPVTYNGAAPKGDPA